MTPTGNRPRYPRLELDFRRAVQQVPVRQRSSLRTWLRRYRRHCRHDAHAARTFHQLDPATGHWRTL
jgi:hypothetical protein